MSKLIPLTKGKFAIVDDFNYEWLNQWKWCVSEEGYTDYAIRGIYLGGGKEKAKYKTISMHRLILNAKLGQLTDHKNHNGLDNQIFNLRPCTSRQNQQNTRKQKIRTSKYKGVYWQKQIRRWVASIRVNGKSKHIGSFKVESKAAKAYDLEAKKHFIEFAYLNFNEAPI